MILIWGTRGITTVLEEGQFNCLVCKKQAEYEIKEIRKWFTFFWVPIIPLWKRINYLECQNCRTAFNPGVFQGDEQKNNS